MNRNHLVYVLLVLNFVCLPAWSEYGKDWICATESAPWSPRFLHSSVVFDGKIWVLGGSSDGIRLNDVWYSSQGSEIFVPDDFETIQGAIDAATDGDTVIVAANVYDEVLSITKSISLQGAGQGEAVIDGGGAAIALQGSSPDIVISNLTIRNASCAIDLSQADRALIEDCTMGPLQGADGTPNTYEDGESVYGIRIQDAADCVIQNNLISQLEGGQGAGLRYGGGMGGGAAYAIRLENAPSCHVISNEITDIRGGYGGVGYDTSPATLYYGRSGGSGGSVYGLYCADSFRNCPFEANRISVLRAGSGSPGEMGTMDSGSGGAGGKCFGVYVVGDVQECRIAGNRIDSVNAGHGGASGGTGRNTGSGGSGGITAGVFTKETFQQCFVINNLIHDLQGGNGNSGASGITGPSSG